MRIVQLIYSLSSGGAEKFVVNLSNELSRMGHEVCVCILRESNEVNIFNRPFLDENVKFVSLGIPEGFSLRKVRIVEKFLGVFKPDVVHCHLNVIPFIFRYAFIHREVKFIHTIHNVAQNACGTLKQVPLNRFFYGRCIYPVAISAICKVSYEALYKRKNAALIVNGAPEVQPTGEYENVKNEIDGIKNGDDVPVFIHVARYDSQKNQSLLIDAFNLLGSRGQDFRLLVIGRGFDDGCGAELKAKACNKVHFLGEKPNVGDYLLCSDAFCLSSQYEGLPISLLEAMSCGLTPICTAVGGIPDVIKDGVNGYLSESVDVKSYAGCIEKFLISPLNKESVKKSFLSAYSISKCARNYAALYNKTIFNSVLSIGPEFPPVTGGIAQVCSTYKEFIFPSFSYLANSCEGGRIRKLWRSVVTVFKFPFMLVAHKEYSIIHIHTASYNSFCRSAVFAFIARLFGRIVVLHIHGGCFKEFASSRIAYVKKVLGWCDAIIALSGFWKAYFENTFAIENVFVLNNPVPVPSIERSADVARVTSFVFLGAINERKGVFNIVKMCFNHKSQLKGKVKIIIAGSGDSARLLDMINTFGVSDIIEYVGWAEEEKKRSLLNQADVFLLPSYAEGVPISILEAESYGLPIISTDVGGIPSIVNPSNGILIKPGDEAALYEAVEKLASDKHLRTSLGRASSDIVSNYYPDKVSASLIEIYTSHK